MGIILKLSLVFGAAFIAYKVHKCCEVPELPKMEDTYWGIGDPTKEDTSIKPFKINVSNKTLEDLKYRLKSARDFQAPLEGIQHQYGLNTNLLKDITQFWLTKYDWKTQEKFLNQYPQYKVSVQGLKIHYLHIKPKENKNLVTIPLLMLHGWPGSIREFYEIIPLLTTPQPGKNFIFELIVPSLPGYGFSEAAARPGLGAAQVAVLFKNFMKTIGYDKYYIHGGDWGSVIVQTMAIFYPNTILGVHSNMCPVMSARGSFRLMLASYFPRWIVPEEHESKVYPLLPKYQYLLEESGYLHLQATKPDTIGAGLNDSPAGLAAYIIEKFVTWTNPDWKKLENGGLTKKYTYTSLLDNVMIYWITNSITTSMRLYSETFNKAHRALNLDDIPVLIPSACARFPHEIMYIPDALLHMKYKNLIHVADYNDGGHFAAFELPKVLAADIWTAFQKMVLYNNGGK